MWYCQCGCGEGTTLFRGDYKRYVHGHNQRGTTHDRGGVGSPPRHGYTGTKTYASWQGMRTRCLNPVSADYHHYGGRGISIDSRWDIFENFLADMGDRPEGRTLDRTDNDGNYGPDNCRWATAKEQRRNQRTKRQVAATRLAQLGATG